MRTKVSMPSAGAMYLTSAIFALGFYAAAAMQSPTPAFAESEEIVVDSCVIYLVDPAPQGHDCLHFTPLYAELVPPKEVKTITVLPIGEVAVTIEAAE